MVVLAKSVPTVSQLSPLFDPRRHAQMLKLNIIVGFKTLTMVYPEHFKSCPFPTFYLPTQSI